MDHKPSKSAPKPWGIAELPKTEEPLHRILHQGPHALSNTELLSLILQGTTGKRHPLDMSAHALGKARSLRLVSSMSPKEMAQNLDLPERSSARIAAAMELSRRVSEEEIRLSESLCGAEEAYRFLKPRLADLPHEVFAVIFLNQKHGVLAYRELFKGTISASTVHPREVVKEVLKENAAAVILAHNHPSGHVSPSPDDLRLTEEMKALLKHLDVRILDHIIVGGNSYLSFAREGMMG